MTKKPPQRGKKLEADIKLVNLRYRKEKRAFILFQELPVKVVAGGTIPVSSTVDFLGILAGGRFLAFDCKECGSLTSFPLSEIRGHQVEYLNLIHEFGGIGFILLHMYKLDKYYRLNIEDLMPIWNESLDGGRKSIAVKDLKAEWEVNIENYLGD